MLWLSAISLSAQTRFDYFFLEAEKSRLNGDYPSAAELYRHALDIKPEIVDPDDIETLSDILVAAVNEAIKRVETTNAVEMEKITGSMGLPGMF